MKNKDLLSRCAATDLGIVAVQRNGNSFVMSNVAAVAENHTSQRNTRN